MELNNKQKIAIIIGIFALGTGTGYFSKPTKVETRTVEVVKEVIKKQEQKDRVIFKEKIVYKDGTVVEREIDKDKTITEEESSKDSSKSSENIVKNDIGLNLSVLAISDISSIATPEYGVHVTKRVISNITVGAMASTDKKVGVSVGLSF